MIVVEGILWNVFESTFCQKIVEKNIKKKIGYMCITEPLCCTEEIGTFINFIDLFKEPSTLLIFNNVQ